MSEVFAARIKARKSALGLTLPQIAERARIPVSTLETYFQGKCLPNVTRVVALSHALSCSADYLMGLTPALHVDLLADAEKSLEQAYALVEADLQAYAEDLLKDGLADFAGIAFSASLLVGKLRIRAR